MRITDDGNPVPFMHPLPTASTIPESVYVRPCQTIMPANAVTALYSARAGLNRAPCGSRPIRVTITWRGALGHRSVPVHSTLRAISLRKFKSGRRPAECVFGLWGAL